MKSSCIALCLFISPILCNASEVVRSAGDKAISFSFDGFEVNEYKYGIGGKYWTSNSIAFTGSLDVERNRNEDSFDNKSENDSYGVSLGIEKHFNSNNSLKASPYFGGETFYSEREDEYNSSYSENYKSYGVSAIIGIEYNFNQEVSLSAEYSLRYRILKSETTSLMSNQDSESKGFSVGSGSLILSVYF